jgi:hypothetical protein
MYNKKTGRWIMSRILIVTLPFADRGCGMFNATDPTAVFLVFYTGESPL